MADSRDWWAKRLGQPAPQPVAPAPVSPQQFQQPAVQQPVQPQVVYQMVQQADGTTVMVPIQMAAMQPASPLSDPAYQPTKPTAAAVETTACPGCGGRNYFTGKHAGTPVKPHCYDCGYPIVQAGSQMGALAMVSPQGPAQQARQVYTPPPEQPSRADLKAF